MSDRHCPLKVAAREAPNLPALVCRDKTLSFAELDQMADRLSSDLEAKEGDRISVLHPPSPLLVALLFAAWRRGASVCPLNLRLPPASIAGCIERLRPKLFIDSFPVRASPLPSFPSLPRSLFLFTSGSTGRPKIAALTLESLLANASSSVPLGTGDRWLLSLPLYHVGGIGILLRCILARAAVCFDERDAGITHLSYVPTQLYRSTPVYKSLKCLLLGGAPAGSFPNHLPVWITYGLTEMGSMVAARKHPSRIDGAYYLGHPLPNREAKIGPDGEIFVRGATLFQGYWEKDRIEPPGEWFATRDVGRIDPVEGLAILGRRDWQFISGGENIQPEEIEAALLEIPGVLEAIVVPKNDPEFGQRPAAFLKADQAIDAKTHLTGRLPKYKIPISFSFLEEIPKIGLKPDRKALFETANSKN
jgi:O-succinylbenzoic acid--CoA ligase